MKIMHFYAFYLAEEYDRLKIETKNFYETLKLLGFVGF